MPLHLYNMYGRHREGLFIGLAPGGALYRGGNGRGFVGLSPHLSLSDLVFIKVHMEGFKTTQPFQGIHPSYVKTIRRHCIIENYQNLTLKGVF